MDSPSIFARWVNYLKWISIFFALQGLMWALIGSFDPLGIYDSLMSEAFFHTPSLPPSAKRVFRFILAPFGATTAGYFILQYFIASNAFAQKQRWAYNAILYAFMVWFVTDTSLSLFHKAYFNIWLANIPALLLTAPVFVFTRKYFHPLSVEQLP